MATKSRRQMATLTTWLILILYICSASSNDQTEKLCAADSTGEEECEAAAYESNASDATDDSVDLPVPTYADDGSDDEAYTDPYESWGEEETQDEESEDDWSTCRDRHEDCPDRAQDGECNTNPGFMHFQCPESCDTCQDFHDANGEICTDNDPSCSTWAKSGECSYNPGYMIHECRRSCMRCFVDTNQFGTAQTLPEEDRVHYAVTRAKMKESIKYMMKIWSSSDPADNRVNYKCRNLHEDCTFWAAIGECEENTEWMKNNCSPACQTCHSLDIRLKCPIEEDNKPIYKPGDLNALMERIVDNSDRKGTYLKYNPTALSRPLLKTDGTPSGAQVDGPWIVQFSNFVSEEEAKALIDAGAEKGYERSADVGEENPDGTHEDSVNEDRTSENAWCDEPSCYENPIIVPVIERIASVVDAPTQNSEYLQLLRYTEGQFYRQHHDYIEYQQELPCGPRALTLFLYLNNVDEGGGTRFPLLGSDGITVQPKLGNAILWPSVLDDSPEVKDPRTDHEALEVTKGIKYGANAWVHTRDYMKASEMDCI